ncbi:RluA family pseudouridine synthase [Paenibacillus campi]|uniref:RluA family pseudouridine synthase n=1 Tax=Paenibacillus campi TaxID=3106031 RepID=UPI002AFDCEC5|nr:RluA family pseudouridine synthase [Paenibacillus sp. SGZ-1014]
MNKHEQQQCYSHPSTDDYYPPIVYTIEPQDEGMLLKTILNRRMGISRKLLSRLKMTQHGVELNGQRVYVDHKVNGNDVVEVRMLRESSDDILPQPMELDILFEDEHLLIVNKFAGVIVHPTHGHYTDTLANGVVHYWKEQGVQFRFRPVHRLDQDTSGVLAIAKNPYAHQHISEQMIRGEVFKSYQAYVHHQPQPLSGRIEGAIDRHSEHPHIRVVTPDGYDAATRYVTLESFAEHDAALVSLELETGRTHQIRVHMNYIGCPLIGDPMYGYAATNELAPQANAADAGRMTALDRIVNRQALHAYELGFTHPATGKSLLFRAPLPADLALLDQRLREVKQ